MAFLYQGLTEKIIAACYQVSNELRAGFVEAVYQNALAVALAERGISFKEESPLSVLFHNQIVGQFYADIVYLD